MVQVYPVGGGGLVTQGTAASNQWVTLYVVKDTYKLTLTQNAASKDVAVDANNDATVDELSVLRVNAPQGTGVEVQLSGNAVTGGSTASNQWVTLT